MPTLNDKDEYSKAFNAEDDDNIPTDDAAEGTGDAEGSAVMLTGGQPEEAEVSAESAPEEAPEVQAEAPTEAEAVAETANPEMTPEDEQRAKSWEGRLKAMEKALKQKESELAAREAAMGQSGDTQALADGGEVMGGGINGAEPVPQQEEKKLSTKERYEKLMSKTPDGMVYNAVRDMFADGGEVEAGEPMDGEQVEPDTSGDDVDSIKREAMDLAADPAKLANVLKTMIADYGRDFVVGAVALAGPLIDAKAEGYVNDVNGSLEGLISDIQAAFSGLHKSSIADAHEDFEEIVEGEEFQAWLDGMDEAAKAKAEQVEGGSAGQVVKLLGQFKDSLKAAEAPKEPTPEDIWAEDAATAVRGSAPVKLPTRAPASDDDEYKRAWAEA